MDQRVPDNLENPAQNPLPEESGRPSQKKEGAESKPVHITGQATVVLTEDNRNRKRSRAPCPVGLNQHVLGLRQVTMSVTAGTTKQSRSRETRAEGERRAAPGRRQRILATKGERKESQRSPACGWIRQAKIFSSGRPAVDGHRYPAMQPGATARAEEDPVIIAFTGSREVGNIACNAAERHRYARSSRNPAQSPVFPSLKPVAFRGAGN